MTKRIRLSKPSRGRPPTGRALTPAERMQRMRDHRKAAGLKPVVTWTQSEPAAPAVYSSHRLVEARSLAMHAVIAAKIERDASLLAVPRENLRRWRSRWDEKVPAWFSEWVRILERPWPQIAAVITEPSENGARLRQSSPFAGVLTAVERRRIYEAFRA